MDTIIRADHVSMCFRMDTTRTTNLKEWFVKWVKRQQKYEKFYALKDVNLAVERGEVLGIVGRNGSGSAGRADPLTDAQEQYHAHVFAEEYRGPLAGAVWAL